ncbi:MAG: hypothetical protein JXD22_05555 [Sedimentisphaerales bacterium]|nr:hypothetical protein [Sedimentisphaerales bacterium]
MKKNAIYRHLSLFLLMLLISAAAGCAPNNRLTPRFKSGQKFSRKITLVCDMRMMFPGADHQENEMVLNYQVRDVRNGVATVDVKIDSIKSSMRSLSVQASFDSENPQANSDKSAPASSKTSPAQLQKTKSKTSNPERFCKNFVGLKGTGYSARVDRNGKVLELVDVNERIQRAATGSIVDGSWGGHQVALLLSPNNLRDYVSPASYQALADVDTETDLGKSRLSTEIAETPRAIPVMIQKKFTLKEITSKNNEKLAILPLEIYPVVDEPLPEFAREPEKKRKPEMIIKRVDKGTMGKLVVSLSDGQLVSFEEKFFAEITLVGMEKLTKPSSSDKKTNKTFYMVQKTIERL